LVTWIHLVPNLIEVAGDVSGTLAVVFRGVESVFEDACNVSGTAKDVSGPSGKVGGPSGAQATLPKNSGGRPGKENTRRILLFRSPAGSGIRRFSRIPPLVPPGLRYKTVIVPLIAPARRHN